MCGTVGLKQTADQQIWTWAKENAYTVVTADADFIELSNRLGWPPKVIRPRALRLPFFRVIEQLLLGIIAMPDRGV